MFANNDFCIDLGKNTNTYSQSSSSSALSSREMKLKKKMVKQLNPVVNDGNTYHVLLQCTWLTSPLM